MIDPSSKTKFILINPNASVGQNDAEYFDTIEEVTDYIVNEKMLPEDLTVYELAKEIKFKLVPI